MVGIDLEIGGLASRLWIAAGSAALLVVICTLIFRRLRTETFSLVGPVFLIVLGVALGTSFTWAIIDRDATRQDAWDRAIEQLKAQAHGSPLACLDPSIGETIESACTKEVFASPATVASEISYVEAQLALLSDVQGYAGQRETVIDSALVSLQRSLEADRYGLVAYVLGMRGCTSESCKALEVLHDPARLQENLRAQTFDHYIEQYREAWTTLPQGPVARLPDVPQSGQIGLGRPQKLVNINFPSAASIPPIHIMDPEKPTQRGVPTHTVNTQTQPIPFSLAGNAAGTDPVWSPTPSPPSSSGASIPAVKSAHSSSAPLLLTPFTLPPATSVGASDP